MSRRLKFRGETLNHNLSLDLSVREFFEVFFKSLESNELFYRFAASSTAFLIGNILAWSAPVSPKLAVDNEYDFLATEFDISWLGSSMTLGK